MKLLSHLLRRFVRKGTLRVRDAEGNLHQFGNGSTDPDVSIHRHDRKLYTAEAYMDGTLTLERGS